MINGLFDDLDFTKLKLPIEPKHLIYVFLAYKLINNLDKLHIDTPRPQFPKPPPNPMPSVLILLITLFSFYILFGNMTSQMFVRNVEPTKIYVSENKANSILKECDMINKCPMKSSNCSLNSSSCPLKLGKCPLKMSKCPLKMCPLYANSDDLKELMNACISSKKDEHKDNKTEKDENNENDTNKDNEEN